MYESMSIGNMNIMMGSVFVVRVPFSKTSVVQFLLLIL